MLWEENSNQKIKKTESTEKDFYALDKAAFYEVADPEIWDFSEAVEMKREFIAFFIMRAILHKKKCGEKIELQAIQAGVKAQVQRYGYSKWMNDFFAGTFFPALVRKEDHYRPSFFSEFDEAYSFFQVDSNRGHLTITGGGVLKKPNLRMREPIEELFQKYELTSTKGSFYYRTTGNSYFYPLEPISDSRVFFVQERLEMGLPFHFFYIECK
jgi:hypothetical protein